MLRFLYDLRNRVDFALRSHLRLRRPVADDAVLAGVAEQQAEFASWVRRFPWERFAPGWSGRRLVVADVGCRTFVHAAPLDALLASYGLEATLHGIEFDAWRRFVDLRTRYDYGVFHAARIRDGRYHARDFLTFQEPLDLAFLTEPFVTEDPLLCWGLPLSRLTPRAIFAHAHSLLAPRRGLLLVSNPDEEEYAAARGHFAAVGFHVIHEAVQEEPRRRLGALLSVEETP